MSQAVIGTCGIKNSKLYNLLTLKNKHLLCPVDSDSIMYISGSVWSLTILKVETAFTLTYSKLIQISFH